MENKNKNKWHFQNICQQLDVIIHSTEKKCPFAPPSKAKETTPDIHYPECKMVDFEWSLMDYQYHPFAN